MSAPDALGKQFFHVTRAELKPGDTLKPFSELHPNAEPEPWHQGANAWRADRVWVSTTRRHDLERGPMHSYEVEPAHDVAPLGDRRDPDLDSLGYPQFHASSARVVRKLPRDHRVHANEFF